MLQVNGSDTRLFPEDEILFDTTNESITLFRGDKPIDQENGDISYFAMPSDGTGFTVLAKLIADVAGLHAHEIEDPKGYRFIFRRP